MAKLSIVDFGLSITSISTATALVVCAATCLSATPAFSATCEGLASVALKDAKITSAKVVAAGQIAPPGARGGAGANNLYKSVPEFCRVEATLMPTADSDIKVEVWLPTANWNGKFQ